MAPPPETPCDEQQLPFEQALAELEGIVRQLEDGELSLTDSLACYESGIKHLKRCHGLLRAAERKISLLTEIREDGTAVLECFEESEMTLEQKQEARGRRRSRKGAAAADADPQPGLFQ